MMLVTLADGKKQLRIDHDDDDDFVTLQIHAASGMVMNYLKDEGSDSFTDSAGELTLDSNSEPVGVPYEVQAATLMMLGYLYRNRDNDMDGEYEMGYLPRPVMAMLYPLRDPELR